MSPTLEATDILVRRRRDRLLNNGILGAAAGLDRLTGLFLRRHGAQSRRIATQIGTIRILDIKGLTPTAPTWVLLHGFGSQALNWYRAIPRLRHAAGRIIALDLPGHGASEIPKVELDESTMLGGAMDAIDQVLRADEPLIVMGNSMGGFGAVRLVQRRRQNTAGVVLISPFGGVLSEAEAQALMSIFTMTSVRDGLALVDRLFVNGMPLRPALAVLLRAHMGQPHLRALLARCASVTPLRSDELAALPPTLLIWGKQDRILPPSGLAYFRAHLPSTHAFLEPHNYGHSPFFDLGDDVARRVIAWAYDAKII